ncbi:MAG: glycine radical domain-containing protein [Candidatus Helarchaeota archaeon]
MENFINSFLIQSLYVEQEYEDLIVRVSGYSAYFTRLGKRIQDDLIERTDFCNCFI